MSLCVRAVQKGEVPADAAVGRKRAAALAPVPRAVGGRNDSYLKPLQIAIPDWLEVRVGAVVFSCVFAFVFFFSLLQLHLSKKFPHDCSWG